MATETAGTQGQAQAQRPRAFYKSNEVAARWHMHPETIRRMLRRKALASIIIGGRRLIPDFEVLRTESRT